MAALAVDHDGNMFSKIAQQVRLDFVLLSLGIIARHPAAAITPRLFDHALPAEKIRALNRLLRRRL